MKCPKCNKEIADDKLYCESCGSEIRIVPDFEPELEDKIEESLSLVKDELSEEKDHNVTPDNETIWDEELDPSTHLSGIRKVIYFLRRSILFRIFSAVLILSLLIGSVFIIRSMIINHQNNSYDYQLAQSKEAYDKGQYTEAAYYLERAVRLNQSASVDADRYLLADYYLKCEQTANCELILRDLISGNSVLKADAYKKLISVLESENRINDIYLLINSCDDEDIVASFSKYLSNPPNFSIPGGTYNEIQPLKLTSASPGTIYYTLDQSTPTTQSEQYTAPIFLESGEYTVKAIFVNELGIVSETAINYYFIDISVPYQPEVNTYSGYYQLPEMITVEIPVGCEVYYTTDQTIPTVNSTIYREAIPMPLGESYFNFCVINDKGIVSEPTYRYYTLVLDAVYDNEEAKSLLIGEFLKDGKINDPEGHADTVSGRFLYDCCGAVVIDNQCYYLYIEKYEDPTAQITKETSKYYGVQIDSGEICLLMKDREGLFQIDNSNK